MLGQAKLALGVLIIVALIVAPTAASSETIISKEDADRIFSMTKAQWEAYARKVNNPPGWKFAVSNHDTGAGLMGFDPKTGRGLSVQPLYPHNNCPPFELVVGSYYPVGSFPQFTDQLKRQLEQAAMKDLGPEYSVTASSVKLPKFDGVELLVYKAKRSGNRLNIPGLE
jgi:hypothetical protein